MGGYRHAYARALPETPATPAVVALHGFGTTGYRTYRYVASAFHEAGIPLYAPDLLGFGGSDKPEAGYSLPLYADLTAELAGALGLERPVLLGHSMGGKIAAAAAARHPERFAGLVLVNPGGFTLLSRLTPLLADSGLVRWLFGQDWFYHGLLPRTPLGPIFGSDESRADFFRLHGSHAALDLGRAGLRPRAAAATLPTLVLWGEADPILPRRTVRRILRAYPHAEVHLLRNAGHAPMKDAPERFTGAVRRFLRERTG